MPSNKISQDKLKHLEQEARTRLNRAAELSELEILETEFLGRKGRLTQVLRSLKDLPLSLRRELGAAANLLRDRLAQEIKLKRSQVRIPGAALVFDVTEPGKEHCLGHIHPLSQIRQEIEDFFRSYGFSVAEGPELETDYYNFEALNIPPDHPARDIWDTFYIKSKINPLTSLRQKSKLLLRTHTSPMQVRIMEKQKPPLAVIVPGRAFRHEATDARHEHTFNQVEGYYVDRKVSAANLKFILHELFRFLFHPNVKIKLRPSYFPFTEPSFELVMSCPFCREKGCSVCGTGWLEMVGCGMIHPKVFEFAGYPKEQYSGFAFGMGLDRTAMLKYGIPDVRMFYQNDLRFLRQF